MTSREEAINQLEWLIEKYKEEEQELHAMIIRWNDYDDPCSDPGLQYEQEMKTIAAYNEVVEYSKTLELKH